LDPSLFSFLHFLSFILLQPTTPHSGCGCCPCCPKDGVVNCFCCSESVAKWIYVLLAVVCAGSALGMAWFGLQVSGRQADAIASLPALTNNVGAYVDKVSESHSASRMGHGGDICMHAIRRADLFTRTQ